MRLKRAARWRRTTELVLSCFLVFGTVIYLSVFFLLKDENDRTDKEKKNGEKRNGKAEEKEPKGF